MRRESRRLLLRAAGRAKPPPPLPDHPRSILVIRPDHLGDLVLAAPALAPLRAAYPEAKLTAWLGPWGEPVWRHHPDLNGIETCPFPGFTRAPKGGLLAPYRLASSAATELYGRFDLAVNLRCDFWWGAMAACWAGIPVAGYDLPECRPFLSRAVPYEPGLHEIDQNLKLVEAVTGMPAQPGEAVRLFPPTELPNYLPAGAIAIHAGAGAEVKLWDEARWAAVASALAEDAPVALTAGSPEEVNMAKRIRDAMNRPVTVVATAADRHEQAAMAESLRGLAARPVTIVHGLDLPQLAAFFASCRLVIGPDNGPIHVARAVGTPTLALFGPTNPAQFGPHPSNPGRHQVLRLPWRCIPCGRLDYNADELTYHLCVKLIEPEHVLAAARRVLVTRTGSRS
jgi:ADP-heptose:LPS heptosyltransferase